MADDYLPLSQFIQVHSEVAKYWRKRLYESQIYIPGPYTMPRCRTLMDLTVIV
jgi:hypothetical protein